MARLWQRPGAWPPWTKPLPLCSNATRASFLRFLFFPPPPLFPALLCGSVVPLLPAAGPWGARRGVPRRWAPAPTPGLRRSGALPFLCPRRRTGPAGESGDLLRQSCSLTALAGAAPTASAYWRYRWVLIMPSALAAIQMLKLFICSWVSSRQRQESERLPSARPPSGPAGRCSPGAGAGTDPHASVAAALSRGGPAAPQPRPTSFCPVFPGETGAVRLPAEAWG